MAISAGLTPEPNLKIGERGKGRRNRPYQMESTVAQIRGRIYTSTAHSKQSKSAKHPPLNSKLQLLTNRKENIMFLNIDWKGLLKAILKAALPFFIGGAIGVTASGCSSLQTPRTKTQTSAIYAFGLPAIVVTHDATQTADYSGGDTNETMQSNK